ncbi:hypothetical protein NEHOM01_1304 [Nematocida homosporus]|uniref:uncharacterized protein n=1 Tax=Nematocida homosporus TaxID=1912981 RepID=UPI002220EC5B|nr:uncharacterized protein NEHOM01_1304 [Nematocida homosporus]KAI5186139.1 hypothetical protein NEHOM01_1304 [Nematocida homosporus]
MSRVFNECWLNLYLVVWLVVGLCTVWCGLDESPPDRGLTDALKMSWWDFSSQLNETSSQPNETPNSTSTAHLEGQAHRPAPRIPGQANIKSSGSRTGYRGMAQPALPQITEVNNASLAIQSSLASSSTGFANLGNPQQTDWSHILNKEESVLFWKFIKIEEHKEGLSTNTANDQRWFIHRKSPDSDKHELYCCHQQWECNCHINKDWRKNDINKLLRVLDKFSMIQINDWSITIKNTNYAEWLLIISKCLTIFEPLIEFIHPANQTAIRISLDTLSEGTSSYIHPLDIKKLQQVFQDQIKQICRDKCSLFLTLQHLTTPVQQIIWPLVAHFRLTQLCLHAPLMTKINFLNDITWECGYSLTIEVRNLNTTIVLPIIIQYHTLRSSAHIKEDKSRATWASIAITTLYPEDLVHAPENIMVVNLDDYLMPPDNARSELTGSLRLSYDVLVSYLTSSLKGPAVVASLWIDNIPNELIPYKHKKPRDTLKIRKARSRSNLSSKRSTRKKSPEPSITYKELHLLREDKSCINNHDLFLKRFPQLIQEHIPSNKRHRCSIS